MTQALFTEEDLKSYLYGKLPSDCEMINPVLPSPFGKFQCIISKCSNKRCMYKDSSNIVFEMVLTNNFLISNRILLSLLAKLKMIFIEY